MDKYIIIIYGGGNEGTTKIKESKTNASDTFEFTNLNSNTEYTIMVEVRDGSNEYVGSVVKKIKTQDANVPNLSGFFENSTNSSGKTFSTYYVLYEGDTEKIGNKIKPDGSNIPNNWYNYSESRWANIVITDGTIENGQIKEGTATNTTYYTWIPRYEFLIAKGQFLQPASARTEVRFIQGTSKETDVGYQIPDAFWFDKNENGVEDDGEQLTGYWMMKYIAGN